MMQMQTQTQDSGSGKGGGGIAVSALPFDDFIHEIGDKIASLTPDQAAELEAYLKTKGIQKEES